ncbi:snare-like protein [Atractiella rhizophila]|nr:snare-like protein [Atractiella rhizophila]
MASLIAITDLKGKSLIQRSYRDYVPPSAIGRFVPLLSEMEEESQFVTPCFTSEGINSMYIRHNNLYHESCLFSRRWIEYNGNEMLNRCGSSCHVLNPTTYKFLNSVLDEMMDFGYPQTTESKILQEYITQESHKLEIQLVRVPEATMFGVDLVSLNR